MRDCRKSKENEIWNIYTLIYINSPSTWWSDVILFDTEKVESVMTMSLMGFADSWDGRCVLLVLLYTAFPVHSIF